MIYATGTITGGKSGYDPVNGPVAGSETLIDYIRQARRDSRRCAPSCCASTAPADRRRPPTRSGAS